MISNDFIVPSTFSMFINIWMCKNYHTILRLCFAYLQKNYKRIIKCSDVGIIIVAAISSKQHCMIATGDQGLVIMSLIL